MNTDIVCLCLPSAMVHKSLLSLRYRLQVLSLPEILPELTQCSESGFNRRLNLSSMRHQTVCVCLFFAWRPPMHPSPTTKNPKYPFFTSSFICFTSKLYFIIFPLETGNLLQATQTLEIQPGVHASFHFPHIFDFGTWNDFDCAGIPVHCTSLFSSAHTAKSRTLISGKWGGGRSSKRQTGSPRLPTPQLWMLELRQRREMELNPGAALWCITCLICAT